MVLSDAEGCRKRDQGSRRLLEGRQGRGLSISDEVALARACELARRGLGNTAPNPPVGAVLVRGGVTLGEGYHHRRGEPHAEVEALRDAGRRGHDVRGATAFVSLEPCNHTGLTPPCSEALVAAGVARVVVGTLDPNPRTAGGGVARLRAAGIEVSVAQSPEARALIEAFSVWVRSPRPYVHLKMAASLDGKLSPAPGRYWLTGEAARRHVRELRAAADAVLVGAGTVRADDPQLTLRPAHARLRPYHRVVVCGATPPAAASRIFTPEAGHAKTTLLFPAAACAAYEVLAGEADIVPIPPATPLTSVGQRDAGPGIATLDLAEALAALKRRGIFSVLCEGGAHLAASLLAGGFVDRVDWLVAPRFLTTPRAVQALDGADLSGLAPLCFDRVERLGDDLLLSARIEEAHHV